jgi:copper ion binding protein
MTTTATCTINGMTCSHCVATVTEAVSSLPGVEHVHVDLNTGTVTVTTDTAVDRAQLAAAVDDAGYTLA